MKKIGLLNQPLSEVIAGLGHTDTLVIADAGLPIPAQTRRIDLALVEGVPPGHRIFRVVPGCSLVLVLDGLRFRYPVPLAPERKLGTGEDPFDLTKRKKR